MISCGHDVHVRRATDVECELFYGEQGHDTLRTFFPRGRVTIFRCAQCGAWYAGYSRAELVRL